nr:hypothetical protein [Mycobacterium sp. 1274761.0]
MRSCRGTDIVFSGPTNIPLRLSLSTAVHCPSAWRRIVCAREIAGCGMRRSARTSRPTTMSRPAGNVRRTTPQQTVIIGGSWVVGLATRAA